MHRGLVIPQGLSFVARETADSALVGPLSSVGEFVPSHVSTLGKSSATNVTNVRPFSSVGSQVKLKVDLTAKAFVAVVTLKRF